MREFTFSDEDRKAIATDRYHHPHPHVQRKVEVLWLKSHGLPHRQIADLAGVSLRTVQRHLDDYLEGGLKEARAGRRVVYFIDAAHFVRAPFLGCLWCLTRLFVRSATGRKRYSVLGALDAVTHEVTRVCDEGYVTADTVCALLQTLAGAGPRVPITVVLDNARYQRCELVQSLARQMGIHLLFLPSYSPNLNLIERLWRFVRK